MAHGKCLTCNGEKDRHGCPRCDDPVKRLADMQETQRQFWRDVRAGKIELKRAPKKPSGGANFLMQCKKWGPAAVAKREAARAEQSGKELPLSGQDAAMPVGDRDE